ncbi:MAG: FlgD immunoglobulin-like domain containing protein [bacterium]
MSLNDTDLFVVTRSSVYRYTGDAWIKEYDGAGKFCRSGNTLFLFNHTYENRIEYYRRDTAGLWQGPVTLADSVREMYVPRICPANMAAVGYTCMNNDSVIKVYIIPNPDFDPSVVSIDKNWVSHSGPGLKKYPNPFSSSTHIHFTVPQRSGRFSLQVFSLQGKLVRNLAGGNSISGNYSVTWDGRDNRGKNVGAGTYIYQLRTGKNILKQRMMILP